MDPTISVSKGIFVFKNGVTRADKSKKKTKKRKHDDDGVNTSLLSKNITEQPYYKTYKETWKSLQADIENLQRDSYTKIVEELVEYILNESNVGGNLETYGMDEILPAAALLTGINQTDHLEQFNVLSQHIQETLDALVCILQSRDCSTIKSAIEHMVYKFVEEHYNNGDDNEDDEENRDHKHLKRPQCTMKYLNLWYKNNFAIKDNENHERQEDENDDQDTEQEEKQKMPLIVILPDFECFNVQVLQDLILILSSHCSELPFILILGVATSIKAIHNTLPYHVTSKIKLKVLQTEPAPVCMNEIVDRIIVSPKYAFHLSGKSLKFLTHVFLYYDFSINGFIQGFKYCVMEHFFQGNAYALCSNYAQSLKLIRSMNHDDLETIRRLLSFRPYVEGINDCRRIIAILTEDEYLKKKLPQLLKNCHIHFLLYRIFLEFFTQLVADLPKSPLGKYRRELYALSLTKELIDLPPYKECTQILNIMSYTEFRKKIQNVLRITEEFLNTELYTSSTDEIIEHCKSVVNKKFSELRAILKDENDMTEITESSNATASPAPATADEQLKHLTSRHDLKDRLLQMSKQDKPMNAFTKFMMDTLQYIEDEIVRPYLCPLERCPPLHELFVFSDISTVRRNIIGAPRAALHMALNNPHFYLQCKCCELKDNTQLLPTLPDLCIVYKLHLECGRLINLYDWLQAFRSVVDYSEDDEDEIDPQIQARFSRAVAELQFLGYIKMSKRKTDHVTRLTW